MSAATTVVPPVDLTQLPDDPALLKSMLAEVLAALRASRQEGERLRERLDQLLRRLYGPRSERLNPDQLLLFPESPESETVTPPPTEPEDE
jgi:transposase